jgi:hypothetical protein
MSKKKLVNKHGTPLVTRQFNIEITLKVIVTVEAVSIADAENEALNVDYSLTVKHPNKSYAESLEIQDIEIYQEGT